MTNVTALTRPDQATFDDFWSAYPRPVKKALAKAKWDAITGPGLRTRTLDRDSNTYVELELRATPQELVDGALRYREAMKDPRPYHYGFKDDGKYIAHPATFLNQGRWMDYEA